MSAAASFPPVARTEYLDRLAALPSEPLDAVHHEVQEQLALLESEVRRRVPRVRVEAGRTSGSAYFLFSYRTFSLPDSDLDPVVAGITFTPAHPGVTLEADVSGEQTGDPIFSLPPKTVTDSTEELSAAARESARSLFRAAEAIAGALQDRSRRID